MIYYWAIAVPAYLKNHYMEHIIWPSPQILEDKYDCPTPDFIDKKK